MGIYLYTMRKETRVADFNGERVTVRAFRFARKVVGSIFRNTTAWEVRQDNAAIEAFAQYIKNGKGLVATELDAGAPVYCDATKAVWYDTDKFPGELIGFLHKDSRGRLSVKEAGPWEKFTPFVAEPHWRRERATGDGKFIVEKQPYVEGKEPLPDEAIV